MCVFNISPQKIFSSYLKKLQTGTVKCNKYGTERFSHISFFFLNYCIEKKKRTKTEKLTQKNFFLNDHYLLVLQLVDLEFIERVGRVIQIVLRV